MEPSLVLVPNASTSSQVSIANTSNSLGLHDSLQYGARSLAADVAPKHAMQSRLEQWDEVQENLNMTLQRNVYGLHAPVRQLMERSLVSKSPAPLNLGGFTRPSNLHLDILTGKDETIDVKDVLTDRVQSAPLGDFHRAMEAKLRVA